MKWDDIDNGVWTIATEKREKGNAGALVLPDMALDIIEAQPSWATTLMFFAGRGDGHMSGYSKAKKQFDAKLPDIAAVGHSRSATHRAIVVEPRRCIERTSPNVSWVMSRKASRLFTTGIIIATKKPTR